MATKKTKGKATVSKNSAAAAVADTDTELETVKLGQLLTMPLAKIDSKSFPNQRTGDFRTGDSGDEGSSFKTLLESIEETGQKDPITIRLKPKGRGNTKIPYEIVKGFRRFAAIEAIAEKHGVKNPTISVIVKDLDDLEALEENIFENTARDNLKGPDLAWAAFNLAEKYAAAGKTISDNQLAGRMGKNQTYISQLMRIVKGGPKIARLWQDAPVGSTVLSVKKLEDIVKNIKEPDAQEEAFNALLKTGTASNGPKGARGKPVIDIATAQAKRVGALLGRLVKAGLIELTIPKGWDDHLEALGVTVKELTTPDRKVVAKAGKEAFLEAQKDEPETTETTEATGK